MIAEHSEICAAFACDSSVAIRPLGQGNINATYLVDSTPEPFVLQQLNGDVFADPLIVIENFATIYEHLQGANPSLRSGFVMAEPMKTRGGKLFFKDKRGGYWRAQRYIKTASTLRLGSVEQARTVGRTLARFHLLFADLHPDNLKDPLPGFHHLSLYLKDYELHASNRLEQEDKNNLFCHQRIERFREQASAIEKARAKNEMPLQPIHGDPKIDNFIFNEAAEAVGLLDLDTVGAGIVYHDLGDCLRSACSTIQENAGGDVQPMFDLNLCQGILQGYCCAGSTGRARINPASIYDGLLAICFELGVRFFTDHLKGDVYFKVKRHGINLQRAKNQLALCENIVNQEFKIRQLIERIYTKYSDKS